MILDARLTLRVALLLAGALSFGGCGGRFTRPSTPAVMLPPAVGQYNVATYQVDFAAYKAAKGDDAKLLRNKMVYGLMGEIDYVYYEFENKLFVDHGALGITSDIVQLGLSFGSTITNGQRGKTILSALLTGTSGTSLSIDKNIFRQQTVQSITSSMRSERDRLKTIILQELAKEVIDYPFEAARPDLIRYLFAGTLNGGLQQINEQAGTEAQAQKANLANTQVSGITSDDVKNATQMNAAVAKAFAANDFSKLVPFLNAMGSSVSATSSKEKVEAEIRALGAKIATDATLRKKYYDEARKAQLIP